MSMTRAPSTRSAARVEIAGRSLPNSRQRPRLSIGAPTSAAPPTRRVLMNWRRFIARRPMERRPQGRPAAQAMAARALPEGASPPAWHPSCSRRSVVSRAIALLLLAASLAACSTARPPAPQPPQETAPPEPAAAPAAPPPEVEAARIAEERIERVDDALLIAEVPFAPGDETLGEPAREALAALVDALRARPEPYRLELETDGDTPLARGARRPSRRISRKPRRVARRRSGSSRPRRRAPDAPIACWSSRASRNTRNSHIAGLIVRRSGGKVDP